MLVRVAPEVIDGRDFPFFGVVDAGYRPQEVEAQVWVILEMAHNHKELSSIFDDSIWVDGVFKADCVPK